MPEIMFKAEHNVTSFVTKQNRTDIVFQDVYKVYSHDTVYITSVVTIGI